MISAPTTEDELLHRAQRIAGLSIQQLAQQLGEPMPNDLKREKGWFGQLLEKALGATAGSKSEPDFQLIGVELKTLPINAQGKPRESTYVSIVPLLQLGSLTWQTSFVRKKLARVLWVPVEAEPNIPLGDRKIGTALLWSPSQAQEAVLRADWEELTDMMSMGQLEQVTARLGTYLQIRPKGANAKALCWGLNEAGERVQTLPRGFYLRPSFTAMILQEHYL